MLKHTKLYVYCVDLLVWSLIKLDFLFYDFSVIFKNSAGIIKKRKNKTIIIIAKSPFAAAKPSSKPL